MTFETLLTHPAVQALGRALLHFLWQGSLLALLLWTVKAIAPTSARVRYAAASLIMLMMPVALVVTVAHDFRQAQPVANIAPMRSSHAQASAATSRELLLANLPSSGPSVGFSGWVVCLWIAGVLLLSLRATGGWMRAQNLKRRVLPASGELEETMTRLKRRLSISAPVRLYTSAIVQVPTVIGWLRPYILLPVTTLTGLSESQLRAILAHELAHIRRHDYLVNLLQTAIETVLFYHPAVWWVGKQMRIEREHCCDDIAVAACGNAIEYAEALAELEQIRGKIPKPALAATGGELLGRIRRLLGQQPSQSHASPSLGTIAAALALVLFIAGAPVVAQQPAFEVASIKPDVSGQPGPLFELFPGFHVERATLKSLVLMAYGIHDFQLSGGPGWINSDRYNIEAKAQAPAAFSQDYRMLQYQRMQTLLEDRFKLAVHRETKELPIYELTIAKGGPKLQPPSCIQRDAGDRTIAPGKTMSDYCGFGITSRGLVELTTATMGNLANTFSAELSRIVIDRTGISGMFHIHLTFTPDDSTIRLPDIPGLPGEPAPTVDGTNIFTAIQEQLGLKLESAKGPVDVLVIDHVEKPSEN
jgi:uncharacterized protein (TIGR03435 family)